VLVTNIIEIYFIWTYIILFLQISYQNIALIDRQELQLVSKISKIINGPEVFFNEYDDKVLNNIKGENCRFTYDNEKYEVDDGKYDIGDEGNYDADNTYDMETEGIKEEVPFDDVRVPIKLSSDDDDEPLSFHKTNKEKEKKKTGKKRGRKKKEVKVELEVQDVAGLEVNLYENHTPPISSLVCFIK
jgi:hypothetical protein